MITSILFWFRALLLAPLFSAVILKVKAFFGLLKKEEDTYDSIDIDEQETDIHDKQH